MNKYSKENEKPKARSVKLSPEEKKMFKRWTKKQESISAAARSLKMTRQTFYSLKVKGSGSVASTEKIKAIISQP